MKEPMCRHCRQPMTFVCEGKTCYLYQCENNECEAWHNGTEVPKTKLAERLAKSHISPTLK